MARKLSNKILYSFNSFNDGVQNLSVSECMRFFWINICPKLFRRSIDGWETSSIFFRDYSKLSFLSVVISYSMILQGSDDSLSLIHFINSLHRKLKDEKFALIATLVNITSWWNGYMLTRTLHNCLEYCFGVFILYLLFFVQFHLKWEIISALSTLAIYLRLSTATFLVSRAFLSLHWLMIAVGPILSSCHLWKNNWLPPDSKCKYCRLYLHDLILKMQMILPSFLCFIILTGIDSYFYGEITLPPFNFFFENIANQRALYFGQSPWFWNFTHVRYNSTNLFY